jgi:hypothetical protein
LASQAIDDFVLGCLNDPGARRFGNAVSSPLIYGRRKRILGGVLGEFEIAKLTYESCNNPTQSDRYTASTATFGFGSTFDNKKFRQRCRFERSSFDLAVEAHKKHEIHDAGLS